MKKSYVKLCYKALFFALFIFLNSNAYSQIADSAQCPPNSFKKVPALNFKDTDIRDILRGLALEYKTNIIVDNRINRRISIALFDLSLFDALKIIASDNNLNFRFDNNRFFITEPEPAVKTAYREPEPQIDYNKQNGRIDIKAENVDLKLFVNKLRETTGRNYLLTSGASGRISGELTNIPLKTGLSNILLNNGYYFIEKDSIYYISRSSHLSTLTEPGDKGKGLYWVSAKDESVTLDITNANLLNVLSDISNQLGLQIIFLDAPKGNVTVKCFDATLEQALYYLFKGTGYTYKKANDAYIVGGKEAGDLNTMKLVKLNYLRSDRVIEQISKELFPSIAVQNIIEHNGLLLIGPQEEIVEVEEYISIIDNPVPQVMIEAMVIDYNLDNIFESGLRMGTGDSAASARPNQWFPGLDVTAGGAKLNNILHGLGEINVLGAKIDFAKVKLPDDFYANIQMLESNGFANIKSRPLLSTLNGHTASLEIGTTQYYVFNEILPVTNQLSSTFIQKETLQKLEANISFEITPWVGPNNELTLEIKPDFQTPVGKFSPDKNIIPSINRRTLESTIKLRDGETIVLGGLIQEEEIISEEKFPLLGDIPILGEFFTHRSNHTVKGELIIYLTPRIFYEDQFGYSHYEYAEH
ncbi:hypothetical protein ACFLR4_03605 [Bacteroidota bacterium]